MAIIEIHPEDRGHLKGWLFVATVLGVASWAAWWWISSGGAAEGSAAALFCDLGLAGLLAGTASSTGAILAVVHRRRQRTFTPALVVTPWLAWLCHVALRIAEFAQGANSTAGGELMASLRRLSLALTLVTALAWMVAVACALVFAWLRRKVTPWNRCRTFTMEEVRKDEVAYVRSRQDCAFNRPAENAPVGEPPRIGVSFSGGGIRSATFNLGMLQALVRYKRLPFVDYLSTVSGGGYIGSCLSSLLSRASGTGASDPSAYEFGPGAAGAQFGVTEATSPLEPDGNRQPTGGQWGGPLQIGYLRTHGNFLIVRTRLFSRDMLRAVGHVLGGVFYHLLVFLTFLTAVGALYWAAAQGMIGSVPQALASLNCEDGPTPVGTYVAAVSRAFLPSSEQFSVLVWVFLYGVVAASVLLLFSVLLWSLWVRKPSTSPDVEGQTIEESREFWFVATLSVTLVTLGLASGFYVHSQGKQGLGWLVVPLGFYFGAQALLLLAHGVLSQLWGRAGARNVRSRYAAAKGVSNYATIFSVGVLLLPLLIDWVHSWRWTSTFGWVASAGAARLLSSLGANSAPPGKPGAAKPIQLGPAVLKLILSTLVIVLIVVWIALVCSVLWDLQAEMTRHRWALGAIVCLLSVVLFVFLGVTLDFNRLSMHYFYRDRLVETYLQTYGAPGAGPALAEPVTEVNSLSQRLLRDDAEMPLTALHGIALTDRLAATPAPYQIIVTALNLTSSHDLTRRDRKSDHFEFAKLFCGSTTTGFVRTFEYRSGETKLARAMAISGAAASSAMGRSTFLAQSIVLTLLNVRLGQWIENPRYKNGVLARRCEGGVFWPYYLLREMFGATNASKRLINVSDGGHTGDNVGIVPLLRRECELIIACDAEADQRLGFGSLATALRQAYVDLNIKIDINFDRIAKRDDQQLSPDHMAVGRIRYPTKDPEKPKYGWLLVMKSSVTGDELARITNYAKAHCDFPHESTADQFFDDDQFESYRELGYHIGKQAFSKMPDHAWTPHDPRFAEFWNAAWEKSS